MSCFNVFLLSYGEFWVPVATHIFRVYVHIRRDMKTRYSDEDLHDISLRNHYQTLIGKGLRKYQWENLKRDILASCLDTQVTKPILEIVAKYKKVSPNWKIDPVNIYKLNAVEKTLPLTGLDGASLFQQARNICKYEVSDRTVRQWFYDVCHHCQLDKMYSKDICLKILIKAMTSQKRLS